MHPLAILLRAQTRASHLAGHNEEMALALDPTSKGSDLHDLAVTCLERVGFEYRGKKEQPCMDILVAIAGNPSISKETTKLLLETLYDSERRDIAEAFGSNPARFIGRLEDPILSEKVDEAVAVFTTDRNHLRELAFHSSAAVRAAVASNESTPADLLEALAHDPDKDVQDRLIGIDNLKVQKMLATSQIGQIRISLAELTTLGVVLDILGDDADPEVRYNVAQNDHTWEKTRERMHQRDNDLAVEERTDLEIASDPRAAPEDLARLIYSKNREVRHVVAGNPNTTPTALYDLLASHEDDKTLVNLVGKNPDRLLRRMMVDETQNRIDEILAVKATDPDVLRELFASGRRWLVEDISWNKHTPNDVREAILMMDNENDAYRVTEYVDQFSESGKAQVRAHRYDSVRRHAANKTKDPEFLHQLVVEEKSNHPDHDEFIYEALDNKHKSKATKDLLWAWSEERDL